MRETISVAEAAAICNVQKVTIFAAIKQKRLRAEKVGKRWQIFLSALDEYRREKYSRLKRKLNGSLIYDIEGGRWPLQYVATWLTERLGRTVSENRVYYLMKTGVLPVYRQGKTLVFKKEDVEKLYNKLDIYQDRKMIQMRLG